MLTGEPDHFQTAVALYLIYLQKDPEEVRPRILLATSLQYLGDVTGELHCFEEAIEQLHHASRYEPDNEAIYDEWGCALIGQARLIDDPAHIYEVGKLRDEAQKRLAKALSLGSNEALYHLAWLYAQAGDHPQALNFLEKALRAGSLPPAEQLEQDEYLGELRSTQGFKEFNQLKNSR